MKNLKEIQTEALRKKYSEIGQLYKDLKSQFISGGYPKDFKERGLDLFSFIDKFSMNVNNQIGACYIAILLDILPKYRVNSIDGMARLIIKYRYNSFLEIDDMRLYFSDFNKIKSVMGFLKKEGMIIRDMNKSIKWNNKKGVMAFDSDLIKRYYSLMPELIKVHVDSLFLDMTEDLFSLSLDTDNQSLKTTTNADLLEMGKKVEEKYNKFYRR